MSFGFIPSRGREDEQVAMSGRHGDLLMTGMGLPARPMAFAMTEAAMADPEAIPVAVMPVPVVMLGEGRRRRHA